MEVFWFWILFILIIFAVAAAPWGYTRARWPYRYGGAYRYYPSAGAGLVAFLILLLVLAWPDCHRRAVGARTDPTAGPGSMICVRRPPARTPIL